MTNGQKLGYIRVSTVEQNTTRQLENLDLHRIFTDKCSGKDAKRPQLQELMQYARLGDTIFVHSMDRLARNLDDLRSIVSYFTNRGIAIHFVKEQLIFNKDESSSIAKLMLSVMGAFAEFERSLIKERQLEGILIAKKQGKYKGRSKCLTDADLLKMQTLLNERHKKTEIAKQFNISRDTLYLYLNKMTS